MPRDRLYILGLSLIGAVAALWAWNQGPIPAADWLPFAVLTALTCLVQTFRAGWPGRLTLYVDNLFHFSALLLIHPFLFVLLVLISHTAESLFERIIRRPDPRPWINQGFNMAMYLLAGFVAFGAGSFIAGTPLNAASYGARMVVGILLAAPTHMLTLALVLAGLLTIQGDTNLIEIGLFDPGVLLTDFVLLMMGYAGAILWTLSPPFLFLAVAPLLLVYRTLMIPQLEQAAQTDGKTGLLNAQHFMERSTDEFEKAQRRREPITVLMADLDLLRNINNTYGHLAGDAVLAGVGKIINDTVRESDLAGRFGGEEFAIALPNVAPKDAHAVAERLCQTVEQATFPVETSPKPIRATMSIGLASFPQDATTLKDLLHKADIAVYQAKLKGRNCVVCSHDISHHAPLPQESTIS